MMRVQSAFDIIPPSTVAPRSRSRASISVFFSSFLGSSRDGSKRRSVMWLTLDLRPTCVSLASSPRVPFASICSMQACARARTRAHKRLSVFTVVDTRKTYDAKRSPGAMVNNSDETMKRCVVQALFREAFFEAESSRSQREVTEIRIRCVRLSGAQGILSAVNCIHGSQTTEDYLCQTDSNTNTWKGNYTYPLI